jgi:hypothetical protein
MRMNETSSTSITRPVAVRPCQSVGCAGTAEASYDGVALLDENDDLLVPVGKRGAELLERRAELGREPAGGELVERLEAAGVDHVIDQSVHELLVRARSPAVAPRSKVAGHSSS